MIIPKETLEALKNELPAGAQVEIAEKLSFSPEYVSRVLGGAVPISMNNMKIINEAQKIVREVREAVNNLNKEFNK